MTEPERAWRVHVDDSLTGLESSAQRASRIADIGSGAGFPGLVLAAALPDARVDLIESVGRKCDFIERAIDEAGIANARVFNARSEELAGGEGREAYDAVTARAVGRLSTLAELASPLLEDGRRPRRLEGQARRRRGGGAGAGGRAAGDAAGGDPRTSAPTRAAHTATFTCCASPAPPPPISRAARASRRSGRAEKCS